MIAITRQVFALLLVVLIIHETESWWSGRRRRRRTPTCVARNCQVGQWSGWSDCTHRCGNAGTQSRTRAKTVDETCKGTCPYHLSETQDCNRNACQNGGVPASGHCSCKAGFTGTCCEQGRC